eukprot:Blabericola_migrator_1__8009@NODE_4106_length_1329_cov_316_080824_g2539_i0_p3_GENE_NODE_4106_length_1329_cov_316_080824_g2539_i0NODE_4106_length_1329_cov_316_080824_g2539_i0_p3_ORF_typecomplete_len108_score4_74EP400_N/PF15790_5/0_051IL17R_D_N/PF16742_5/0_14_NODE_4106_length_1329_cov_316_080824_g2539_i0259582
MVQGQCLVSRVTFSYHALWTTSTMQEAFVRGRQLYQTHLNSSGCIINPVSLSSALSCTSLETNHHSSTLYKNNFGTLASSFTDQRGTTRGAVLTLILSLPPSNPTKL